MMGIHGNYPEEPPNYSLVYCYDYYQITNLEQRFYLSRSRYLVILNPSYLEQRRDKGGRKVMNGFFRFGLAFINNALRLSASIKLNSHKIYPQVRYTK